jgi:hypothetical protein
MVEMALRDTHSAELAADPASREERARALLFLGAAISFVASVSLWSSGNELQGIYVGLWVPSILALGAIVLPRGERS